MGPKAKVIIILGPTASGKTSLAVQLARKIGGEIISADSRQVFKKMDIGSGKDLSEYESVPYHLIDIRPAGDDYSVLDFQRDALSALSDIVSRKAVPIICGGTAHYVKALLDDYRFPAQKTDRAKTQALELLPRETLYNRIKSLGLWENHHWETDSRRRMARAIEKQTLRSLEIHPEPSFRDLYTPRIFFTQIERETLLLRVEHRLKQRFQSGLIEEVESLRAGGVSHDRLERYGLEYRWISRYLNGDMNFEEMFQKLLIEIRRYAKRQMTFLRHLQKKGHRLEPVTEPSIFFKRVVSWLSEPFSISPCSPKGEPGEYS
ncbi:tRNA (adenosine(37)-N6)-dimethylallyltransferase MiaA [bacterium]|nr:tRNA (adenosine(37)-N6)-dimethylallyltransferase MiaA [bacterium]